MVEVSEGSLSRNLPPLTSAGKGSFQPLGPMGKPGLGYGPGRRPLRPRGGLSEEDGLLARAEKVGIPATKFRGRQASGSAVPVNGTSSGHRNPNQWVLTSVPRSGERNSPALPAGGPETGVWGCARSDGRYALWARDLVRQSWAGAAKGP